MYKKIINKVYKKIVTNLLPYINNLCGIKQINEQLESIYYIINHSIDIRNFPKASGLLRQYQIADTELLRIFHEICEKYKLQYWLDFGTLLGAVRHGGFIPWDDDLDVCMPREDFIRAQKILPDEVKKYNIDYGENEILFLTKCEAGIGIDIFAMENVSKYSVKDSNELKEKLQKYIYFLKTNKEKINFNQMRKEMIGAPDADNPIYYRQQEFWPAWNRTYSYEKSEIYPLKEMKFEEYYFHVPNNYDKYLQKIYCDYMLYPKNGMLHHVENGIHRYENSIKNNCDIDKIIYNLKMIKIL